MPKYSDQQFIDAVKESISIAQVLIKLGLNPTGGNYKSFKNTINRLNLDTSHFTGQASNKGKSFGFKRPIENYLNNEYSIHSHQLKVRLIKEGLKKYKCEECGLTEWNNKPISFDLHHIDGNHENNQLINLQILCPNCHSQTDNHRGKNQKRKKMTKEEFSNRRKELSGLTCKDCNIPIISGKQCIKCYSTSQRRVNWPSKEELEELIKNNSWSALGRQFGVSDNAVRKWAKSYGII